MNKLTTDVLRKVRGKIKAKLSVAKNRPGKQRRRVAVTADEVLDLYIFQEGKCALTGRFMDYETDNVEFCGAKANPNIFTIDRIDPRRDYFIDNIQLICWDVNLMKNKIDQEHFIKVCKMVK